MKPMNVTRKRNEILVFLLVPLFIKDSDEISLMNIMFQTEDEQQPVKYLSSHDKYAINYVTYSVFCETFLLISF